MTVIEVGADLFESAFYVISQKVSYTWSQFADMFVSPSPNICQYIRLTVCTIRFVGSRMRENRTSGSEQGYAP